jgi:hypothetical protein
VVERALQVAEGDVGIHREAFDLMKHGRVGHVVVDAVHTSGNDDSYWWWPVLHDANLDGGSVRAQEKPVVDEECVLHIPRRVIRRKVQRLEVVVVVLDVGAFGDAEAE